MDFMSTTDTAHPPHPLEAHFKAFQGTKLYDLLAASPIIAWYGFCEYQQIPLLLNQLAALNGTAVDALFVASLISKIVSLVFVAVLGVMLTIRHVPLAKSAGLLPRIAAIAGTYLGVSIVLQQPPELPVAVHYLSIILIIGGTVFSLYSVTRLGRSISMMPEARRLVTDGPYGVIRHPLYLGEGIALLGLTLQFFSAWSLFLFALQCAFQFERMKNEERVLADAFPDYAPYKERTARLVPGLY
ncbi:MAG: isoprenylcysteine carboxylmethyltransferase family protein [Xanthobacteraceae bacterium]|nr:MAG: isoprenylcysteine carboxylmethyltransferase family protein [Xanthobacteraceae bacterium]